MRLGLNLRGDLAKLDDAEIGERFERALDDRERLARLIGPRSMALWNYNFFTAQFFGRGPFHARIFYRAFGLLLSIDNGSDKVGRLYQLDCEIKDLRDEMIRWSRNRSAGPSPTTP